MPLPTKTIHDYQRLARDHGLEYGEIFAPSSVWVKVRWHCPTCGRDHYKSYHTIKHQRHACRCQNGRSLPLIAYQQLAAQYNLELVNEFEPHNIFQPVKWRTEDGRVIEMTYRDLKYTKNLDYILNYDEDDDEIYA